MRLVNFVQIVEELKDVIIHFVFYILSIDYDSSID